MDARDLLLLAVNMGESFTLYVGQPQHASEGDMASTPAPPQFHVLPALRDQYEENCRRPFEARLTEILREAKARIATTNPTVLAATLYGHWTFGINVLGFRGDWLTGEYNLTLPGQYDVYVNRLQPLLADSDILVRHAEQIYERIFNYVFNDPSMSLSGSFLTDRLRNVGPGLFQIFLQLYNSEVDRDEDFIQIRLHIGQPSKILMKALFFSTFPVVTALSEVNDGSIYYWNLLTWGIVNFFGVMSIVLFVLNLGFLLNDGWKWMHKKAKEEGAVGVSAKVSRGALPPKRKTSVDLITLFWWGSLSLIYMWKLFPFALTDCSLPDIQSLFIGFQAMFNIFCYARWFRITESLKHTIETVNRMDKEMRRQTLRIDSIVKLAVKKEGAYACFENTYANPCTPASPLYHSSSCATTIVKSFPEPPGLIGVSVSVYPDEQWKAVIIMTGCKDQVDAPNVPVRLLHTAVNRIIFCAGSSKQCFTLDNEAYTFAEAGVRSVEEKESEIRRLATYILNLNTKNFVCPEEWIQNDELSLYASVSEDIYRRGGLTTGEHGSWDILCSHRALHGPGPALVRHVKQELEDNMRDVLGYVGWTNVC